MNECQLEILAEARKNATDIIHNNVNKQFVFHNLDHTEQVVNAAREIAGYYQLDDNDHLVLLVSAWFHDTGFSTTRAEEHEKESIKLANDFLNARNVECKLKIRIASCIQATHMPQKPLRQVEKILCDADLYHLGTNIFIECCDRLRQEMQNYFSTVFSNEEWRELNIKFLQSHKYFTSYCRQKLEPVKQEWIKQLQNKQGTLA